MAGAGLLTGLTAGLEAYQSQLDRQQKIQVQKLKLQQEGMQLQYLTQQAQAGQMADKLSVYAAMGAGQDQGPPNPYSVNPPQGGGGGQPQQPPQQGGLPGAQPMPQGGGQGMPQGQPMGGGQPQMQGGMPPQQMQRPPMQQQQQPQMGGGQQPGLGGMPQPPTMQSIVRALAQHVQQGGQDVNNPGIQQGIMAAAKQAYPQQMEQWKSQLEMYKVQQSAKDRESGMAMHEQDHQDTMRLREAMMAAAQANHSQAAQRAGWELFQSKDGTVLRVNKDTGEVKPMDVGGLSKVGATPGGGDLSPDAVKTLAQEWITTGQQPTGFARNQKNLTAITNEFAAQAKEKGWTGADIAGQKAQFGSTMAAERAVGTRTANMEIAANEVKRMAPIALSASNAVDRTKYPDLNSIILAGRRKTGDTSVVKLGLATNSLVYEYAKFLNPNGIPTDSDKAKATEILSDAWSQGQFGAAVQQIQTEIGVGRQGLADTKSEITSGARGAPDTAQSGGWSFEPVK